MQSQFVEFLSELSIERAVEQAQYALPIRELRTMLTTIDKTGKRYWLDEPLVVMRSNNDLLSWILLYFSFSIPGQMTDELIFALPVLSNTVRFGQVEDALVCLDADTLLPVREGLYLEHGRVLRDSMEDWYLVWPSLGQALSECGAEAFTRLNESMPMHTVRLE
jgi:hypothetical protein